MTTFTSDDRKRAFNFYEIYDENGELMRIVGSKAEAQNIVKTYTDWSYKFVKKEPLDLSSLGDAPF